MLASQSRSCLTFLFSLVTYSYLHTTTAYKDTLALESGFPTIPPDELQALQDLYDSANGPYWDWYATVGIPWNFTQPDPNPCAEVWQGINCTYNAGNLYSNVHKLELDYYDLIGTIPPTIASLSRLNTLNFNFNALTGAIPASIGNLTELRYLYMTYNHLDGTIPLEMLALPHIQTLDITSNKITGTVPVEVCEMSTLQVLSFHELSLHGTIPECVGNLSEYLHSFDMGYNRFTGTIPVELQQLTHLHKLDLGKNHFHGTLPSFIGNLTDLLYLSVDTNNLHGTVPLELCQLTQLITLYLDVNSLQGNIYDCIGDNMPELEAFHISNNLIRGTIPASLGNTQLLSFAAGNNFLTGTIPDTLQNLVYLNVFYVGNNSLHGTIPSWISELPLYTIVMGNNNFTGTIPDSWADLQFYCNRIFLGNNQLTGTIPEFLSQLENIIAIDLHHNHFVGTIPSFLGELPILRFILLSENHLNGTIPLSLQNLPLIFLDLADNLLTGTIPPALAQVENLISLNLSNNYLSGTIPVELGKQTELRFLSLSNNQLNGTIPAVLSQLPLLLTLLLNDNKLVGTIPGQLGNLLTLSSLYLSNNHFTGTVPTSLANLSQLEVLFLQNNQLRGSLVRVFGPVTNTSSYMRNLTSLQLSDNQFSGPVPEGLFQLPNLVSVAAVSNCFTGSLPLSICTAQNLATLALDGLQSAPACQQKLLKYTTFDAYLIGRPLGGGIPACMYEIPSIHTLHLSGNGIDDTLPDNVAISPTLTDLSLSHNQLQGTIPRAFQERSWRKLDLSYNRLSGSLNENIGSYVAPNSSLQLEENRLSGRIPSGLNAVQDISILDSNLFSCNPDRSDLPRHNPDVDEYQCGSDSLNFSLYAWLALSCGLVGLVGATWYFRASLVSYVDIADNWHYLEQWWSFDKFDQRGNFARGSVNVRAIGTMGLLTCAFIMAVLLPVYGITTAYYGTYTQQYAWTLSAAYLAGRVPFALELVCFILLLCLLQLYVFRLRSRTNAAEFLGQTEKSVSVDTLPAPSLRVPGYKRALAYAIFITVNILVVAGVNIAYVYISLYETASVITLAQILLSLFKVLFNAVCAPLILRWSILLLFKREQLAMATAEFAARESLQVQLFVMLFNNIAIPCIVVVFISPNCFLNVFKPANSVSATFVYAGGCVELGNESDDNIGRLGCTAYETYELTTSYDPPFTFNYQCSSSIITYYAPAYVIMCIMASFVLPLAQITLQQLHQRSPLGTRWHSLLDAVLLRNLKPVPDQSNSSDPDADTSLLLNPNQLFLSLLMFLGIMVTFGAVFPPLALTLALTLVVVPSFAKLKIGRFLHTAVEKGYMHYLDAVDLECKGIASVEVLQHCLCMIYVFAWLFYALFLYDTLAGAVGYEKAYVLLVIMPLIPVCVYVSFAVRHTYTLGLCGFAKACSSKAGSRNAKNQEDDVRDTIELGVMGSAVHSPMTSQVAGDIS